MHVTCRQIRGVLIAVAGALIPILLDEPVLAASPSLTGRWGESCVPQQLTYEYTSKKNQALVVVTMSTHCPLARRCAPVLNELQRIYDHQGIQFIGLFPNGSDDLREMAEYALDTQLMFPVYKDDPENSWHEQLGLKTTPEVTVLDTRFGFDAAKVVYRGQINGMWAGGAANHAQRDYLADALASFVAGVAPPLAETAASGCPIKKHAPKEKTSAKEVTYHKDIARLIQRRCTTCHREGEIGAELFAAFDSYDAVAAASDVMLSRIESRIMPPWHAIADPDNGLGGFKNDPRLTDDEISLFRAWVAQGCPAGDPKDAPPEQRWNDPAAWQIGTPDLVFAMPEPYRVPKFRLSEYQFYRIPANFSDDRYIQSIELKPGNKAVVHHIGAIVGPAALEPRNATEMMLDLYGLTGEAVKKVGDYVSGDPFNARTYPEGYGLKLPARHDLYFEVHYTPTGKEEKPDQSTLGIIWADKAPEHLLETKVFNRKDIRLRPHDMHYEKTNYYLFPTDVLIYALAPHMHFRGKDFTLYKVEHPQTDRERRQLIMKIPTYDFNWQRTYEFENPLRLKAGEALLSIAHFDNSHYNPNNPDPEALVRYGIQSEQEMLNVRVKYEVVDFGEAE